MEKSEFKYSISDELHELINKELEISKNREHTLPDDLNISEKYQNFEILGIYEVNDMDLFLAVGITKPVMRLYTLDELLERDKQREADGFPRRIRLGKYIKPVKGSKEKIIVVPTTTEPKF